MSWSISVMLNTFVEEDCFLSAVVESWEEELVGGELGLVVVDAFELCLTVGLRGRDGLGGRLRGLCFFLP